MDRHCPPPVLFSELAEAMLPQCLRPAVERLLDLKKNEPEKMTIPHMTEIDDFLRVGMEEAQAYVSNLEEEKESHWESLNRFFLEETSS